MPEALTKSLPHVFDDEVPTLCGLLHERYKSRLLLWAHTREGLRCCDDRVGDLHGFDQRRNLVVKLLLILRELCRA